MKKEQPNKYRNFRTEKDADNEMCYAFMRFCMENPETELVFAADPDMHPLDAIEFAGELSIKWHSYLAKHMDDAMGHSLDCSSEKCRSKNS